MKRKAVAVLISLMMVVSLVGCGGTSTDKSDAGSAKKETTSDAVTIKLCHTDPSGCATTEALQMFADKVTEASDGRLVIEEYADGVMGDDDAILEQINSGANIMNYSDPALLEPYYADYSILFSPYFYDSYEEIAEFAQTDFAKKLQSECRDAGLMVLDGMSSYYGSRQIMANKEINTPADLKGLDFRMPNQSSQLELAQAWGANPVTISFSETYSALQQGVVDCVENPLGALYANSIQEVCSTLNMTNHFYAVNGLVMSTDVFESLDEDLQQILLDEAADFAKYNTEMVVEEEGEVIEKMKADGCTINENVDIDAMKEAAMKVYEVHNFRDGLVDEAFAALDEMRSK